jgi:pilus assembly protein CpaF
MVRDPRADRPVHLFIQQSRLQDGSRRITYITELQGMEGATISLSDIFLFKHQGFDSNGKIMGSLQGTGMRPKFEATLKHHGITLSNKMFGGR